MREICLALSSAVAIVDDEDYEVLSGFRWVLTKGYATRSALRSGGSDRSVSMHRQVMGFPAGLVDHRHGNKLDNRRENLRVVDRSLNNFNRHVLDARNRSGVHGVSWHVVDKKWVAQISRNNKKMFLGNFDDLQSAACARAAAELELFGEVCSLTAAFLAA